MEEDRAQVDLGLAADIEAFELAQPGEVQTSTTEESAPLSRQPKKRFVGRRATAAVAKDGSAALSSSSAVQGRSVDVIGRQN